VSSSRASGQSLNVMTRGKALDEDGQPITTP
jgi:hypothetical protein